MSSWQKISYSWYSVVFLLYFLTYFMSSPQERGITHNEREQGAELLSDHKLGSPLASVGNHEGKAGTIIRMLPGVIYSEGALNTLTNQKKLWNKRLPINWCQKSLAPIELVAQETIDARRGTIVGYTLTEGGWELGIPFAGHSL